MKDFIKYDLNVKKIQFYVLMHIGVSRSPPCQFDHALIRVCWDTATTHQPAGMILIAALLCGLVRGLKLQHSKVICNPTFTRLTSMSWSSGSFAMGAPSVPSQGKVLSYEILAA